MENNGSSLKSMLQTDNKIQLLKTVLYSLQIITYSSLEMLFFWPYMCLDVTVECFRAVQNNHSSIFCFTLTAVYILELSQLEIVQFEYLFMRFSVSPLCVYLCKNLIWHIIILLRCMLKALAFTVRHAA